MIRKQNKTRGTVVVVVLRRISILSKYLKRIKITHANRSCHPSSSSHEVFFFSFFYKYKEKVREKPTKKYLLTSIRPKSDIYWWDAEAAERKSENNRCQVLFFSKTCRTQKQRLNEKKVSSTCDLHIVFQEVVSFSQANYIITTSLCFLLFNKTRKSFQYSQWFIFWTNKYVCRYRYIFYFYMTHKNEHKKERKENEAVKNKIKLIIKIIWPFFWVLFVSKQVLMHTRRRSFWIVAKILHHLDESVNKESKNKGTIFFLPFDTKENFAFF